MTKKIVIPADHSPESIKNVVSIVLIDNNRGLGFVDVRSISLDGTVEEKLKQYKEATGKDWSGRPEQVFSVKEESDEPTTLGLGQKKPYRHVNPVTEEAQKKIDALAKLATRYLEEAKREKIEVQKQKLLTARAGRKTEEIKI